MTESEIASYEELARRLEEGAMAIRNLLREVRGLKGLSLEPSGDAPSPRRRVVNSVDFDLRSFKAMRREGVESCEQLAAIDAHDMIQWRHFGESSLHLVRSRLNDMGYQVRPPWGSLLRERTG